MPINEPMPQRRDDRWTNTPILSGTSQISPFFDPDAPMALTPPVALGLERIATRVPLRAKLQHLTVKEVEGSLHGGALEMQAYVLSQNLYKGTFVAEGSTSYVYEVYASWWQQFLAEHGHRWWVRLLTNREKDAPVKMVKVGVRVPFRQVFDVERKALFPEATTEIRDLALGPAVLHETVNPQWR